LILSRFAGAAADMEEALIVNPYDADEVAKALYNAVTMELDERLDRHGKLLARVRKNDIAAWRMAFMQDLRNPETQPPPDQTA